MTHSMLYFGHFDRNFRKLDTETSEYLDINGQSKAVEQPTDSVDGLHFFYMECPDKEFVAVGVRDHSGVFILRAPILLISERHTDGKGLFTGPHIGDESAARLLVDMIVANPERRDALGRLLRSL